MISVSYLSLVWEIEKNFSYTVTNNIGLSLLIAESIIAGNETQWFGDKQIIVTKITGKS